MLVDHFRTSAWESGLGYQVGLWKGSKIHIGIYGRYLVERLIFCEVLLRSKGVDNKVVRIAVIRLLDSPLEIGLDRFVIIALVSIVKVFCVIYYN